MTHEEKMMKLREQCRIVSTYFIYLNGKIDAFPYTKREFRKALKAVLLMARKHIGHCEFVHNRMKEKGADIYDNGTDVESEDIELIPPFNK